MGSSVASLTTYRLLFVQPDPDVEERICVGLIFDEPTRKSEVVYDRKLSKLRCVAPNMDLELVRFFIEALDATLKSAPETEAALRQYAPQLATSAVRRVAAPLTEMTKLALLDRFVLREASRSMAFESAAVAEAEHVRSHQQEIQSYVQRIAFGLSLQISEHVRAHHVFGKPIPNVDPVSVGVETASKVILVDGVDLRRASPRKGIGETNRVVHTFWQWGRLRTLPDLATSARPFDRVAIVLSGAPPAGRLRRRWMDAHDYAIDQLGKEAELTIDSSSETDVRRLHDVLAS